MSAWYGLCFSRAPYVQDVAHSGALSELLLQHDPSRLRHSVYFKHVQDLESWRSQAQPGHPFEAAVDRILQAPAPESHQ